MNVYLLVSAFVLNEIQLISCREYAPYARIKVQLMSAEMIFNLNLKVRSREGLLKQPFTLTSTSLYYPVRQCPTRKMKRLRLSRNMVCWKMLNKREI